MKRSLLAVVAFAVVLPSTSSEARAACDICMDGFMRASPLAGGGNNINWIPDSQIAACPSGESLSVVPPPATPHASRLRVDVWYNDVNCVPRPGIPPDSIWIQWSTLSGNARLNDKALRTYADDTTDVCGHARVTFPSISGCGTVRLTLFVSGVSQSYKDVVVRSLDKNADGRVTSADVPSCDLNYDGIPEFTTVFDHFDHWHRNALHGTLVRRTNYCETCLPGHENTRGSSKLFWSPSQRYVAHTAFLDEGEGPACKIVIVPSDPGLGNSITQFTSLPAVTHDYDPSWSPLNDFIVFDRSDKLVIRKAVPWSGDPTEVTVTTSDNFGCTELRGDGSPAVSPDGQWVAFNRCNPYPPQGPGGWSLWKVPIAGGTAIQLTPAAAQSDFYPAWSPDGQTIYFQRSDESPLKQELWKVPAAGGTATKVFDPPSSPISHAVQPGPSADGEVLLFGYGPQSFNQPSVFTHTLDLALTSPTTAKVIPNYAEAAFGVAGGAFPILSPALSPDGTRTLLGSKQLWTARRNMSSPPRITQVGTQAVHDTAVKVAINAQQGLLTTVTVAATDPEADPITYGAHFLQDGMTFDPASKTLNWTPTAPVGTKYFVKLQAVTGTWPTASGGSDAILVEFTVTQPSLMGDRASGAFSRRIPSDPERSGFLLEVLTPPVPEVIAALGIFDIAGRRLAAIREPAGAPLRWDGMDEGGRAVRPGVYLYRVTAGAQRTNGSVVVLGR